MTANKGKDSMSCVAVSCKRVCVCVCHRLQLSGSEKEDAKNEALKLSLKYGFVTPLTSMVVTKPQGESTDVLDKPKEGKIEYVQTIYRSTQIAHYS